MLLLLVWLMRIRVCNSRSCFSTQSFTVLMFNIMKDDFHLNSNCLVSVLFQYCTCCFERPVLVNVFPWTSELALFRSPTIHSKENKSINKTTNRNSNSGHNVRDRPKKERKKICECFCVTNSTRSSDITAWRAVILQIHIPVKIVTPADILGWQQQTNCRRPWSHVTWNWELSAGCKGTLNGCKDCCY